MITDGAGNVLAVTAGPGQENETHHVEELIGEVRAWDGPPVKLAGDKAYSAGWVRDLLAGLGIKAVIPKKSNETKTGRFDKKAYKRRNIIERTWSKLKWLRRVATRYEKLAAHYLGIVKVAAIFRML